MTMSPQTDVTQPHNKPATLVLVVGPSGVGKDSLIDAARRHFSGHSKIAFPARHITRPTNAGGEAHIELSAEEFAANDAAGRYCLAWQAHGLSYGIPATALDALAAGISLVVNISRRCVADAEALGVPLAILLITASPQTLAKRLAARGRESAEDIAARLARDAPIEARTARLITICNDGNLAEGEAAFIAALADFIP